MNADPVIKMHEYVGTSLSAKFFIGADGISLLKRNRLGYDIINTDIRKRDLIMTRTLNVGGAGSHAPEAYVALACCG
jgi:hypothetical protein